MPFTVSHAAAVLPLLRRAPLVPAALVVGSMAPDVPYFLPLDIARSDSHRLAWAFTWTAIIGLLLWGIWEVVIAASARDLAPRWLRLRWRAPVSRSGPRQALWTYVSIVIGILTHLFWDAFTHRTGVAVVAWPALLTQFGPLALYKILQFGSGVVGLVALILSGRRWVQVTAPRGEDSLTPQVWRTRAWMVFGLLPPLLAVGVTWQWARQLGTASPTAEELAFTWVSATIGGALLVSVLIALVWWAAVGAARGTRPGPGRT